MKSTYLKAGELKDRIEIKRNTESRLPNGDLESVPVTFLTTFARVTEMRGSYNFETGRTNSEARIETLIRYRPNLFIETGDIVHWRGFSWVVEDSPIVDPWRVHITFTATLDLATTARTGQQDIFDETFDETFN